MSDGIDATVQTMKPPRPNARPDPFLSDPEAAQLVDRNHPVLASGELSYTEVGRGDFPVHIHG